MSPAIFQSSWVQPNLSLTPSRSMVSHSNSENEWDPPWPQPPRCSTTRVFCPSAKQNGPWSLAPLCPVSPGQFPAAAKPCRPTSARVGAGGAAALITCRRAPAPAPRPAGLRSQEPRRFCSPLRSTAGACKPPLDGVSVLKTAPLTGTALPDAGLPPETSFLRSRLSQQVPGAPPRRRAPNTARAVGAPGHAPD